MTIRILKPYSYSSQGMKPNQEDALFPQCGEAGRETRTFIVCDGMGGHEKGEVASECVAETIGRLTEGQPLCSAEQMRGVIDNALLEAYRNLDAIDTSESENRMGTTLAMLSICADGVLTAHIGDSRVYQLREGRGVIFRTRDHSVVSDLIASGELTEKEARTFPHRNVITRAIQPHQDYPDRPSYNVLTDIRKGDVFFICCDGVVEQLEDDDLCRYLLGDKPLSKRLEAVREECRKRNTNDNNTAYLIGIEEAGGMEKGKAASLPDNDSALTADIIPVPWWKSATVWIVASIAIVIMLTAVIFMLSGDGTKKSAKEREPKTEQVQGLIKRH